MPGPGVRLRVARSGPGLILRRSALTRDKQGRQMCRGEKALNIKLAARDKSPANRLSCDNS